MIALEGIDINFRYKPNLCEEFTIIHFKKHFIILIEVLVTIVSPIQCTSPILTYYKTKTSLTQYI